MSSVLCEACAHYCYDELTDTYFCTVNLDEDEMHRFLQQKANQCIYFRNGDDYAMVKKQN